MKTREKILLKALEMFNDEGVHRVGVRDIARALEISPGNLQYHFAQKDLLVAELVRRLHASNTQRVAGVRPENVCFKLVFRMTEETLLGHVAYRGILLSYAEVVASSAPLTAFVREMDQGRVGRVRFFHQSLIANGYLDAARFQGRDEFLRLQLEGLGRLWLPAAVIAGAGGDLPHAAEQRARLMLQLWEPYATDKGRAQIAEILGVEPLDAGVHSDVVD